MAARAQALAEEVGVGGEGGHGAQRLMVARAVGSPAAQVRILAYLSVAQYNAVVGAEATKDGGRHASSAAAVGSEVVMATPRCSIPSRAQPGLERDKVFNEILRHVPDRFGNAMRERWLAAHCGRFGESSIVGVQVGSLRLKRCAWCIG